MCALIIIPILPSVKTLFDKFKGIIEHMKDLYAFHAVAGYFRSSGYFALQPCLKNLKQNAFCGVGTVMYVARFCGG